MPGRSGMDSTLSLPPDCAKTGVTKTAASASTKGKFRCCRSIAVLLVFSPESYGARYTLFPCIWKMTARPFQRLLAVRQGAVMPSGRQIAFQSPDEVRAAADVRPNMLSEVQGAKKACARLHLEISNAHNVVDGTSALSLEQSYGAFDGTERQNQILHRNGDAPDDCHKPNESHPDRK